ncbi:hypothetical protein FOZ63_000228 [Perkinsus olseni]|uniref:Uncharacterized protein n=1 Tax=Perkinsus olseni TaxID=32597 RepID=A0A7J6QZP9_PEROL|nr:hypothetical protein FOZ63_000228 [Perkinsus olseni]
MAVSKSSITNVLWYVGLSCLLVDPSRAQMCREDELLYARVHPGVEYFFVPRLKFGVSCIEKSKSLGFTQDIRFHQGRSRSRDPRAERGNVGVADFMPFNSLIETTTRATETRILRVEYGETSEYVADVRGERCFTRIGMVSCSSRLGREGRFEEASARVKEELQEICKKGFTALKPSPSLSTLNGVYTGSRMERSLEFEFGDGGVFKKVKLNVEEAVGQGRFVTYYPLCDGLISIVYGGQDDSESAITLMILKKSRTDRKQSFIRRRLSRKSRRQRSDDGFHAMCNVEEHGRRNITRFTIDQWDRGLPDDYVFKSRVTRESGASLAAHSSGHEDKSLLLQ